MTPGLRRACLVTVVLCAAFQAVYLPALTRRPSLPPPPPPVLAAPSTASVPAGGAHLEADPPRHDFGMVGLHEVVRQRFTVTNRGPGPAQVVRVWSTCGCTVSQLDRERLEPGESAFLDVTFNGPHPGPFRKSVFVVLKFPDEGLRIDLSGTVR